MSDIATIDSKIRELREHVSVANALLNAGTGTNRAIELYEIVIQFYELSPLENVKELIRIASQAYLGLSYAQLKAGKKEGAEKAVQKYRELSGLLAQLEPKPAHIAR